MTHFSKELIKLDPRLFIVMFNHLELTASNTSHWKYVDDFTLFEIVNINITLTLLSDLTVVQSKLGQE